MKATTTLKISSVLFFLAACIFAYNIGRSLTVSNTVNHVKVIHLTVLSSRHDGDYLMVETDSGVRTELQTFGLHPPQFQAGDKLDLEVWKDNTYVFKGDMRGEETTYREEGWDDSHKLGDN